MPIRNRLIKTVSRVAMIAVTVGVLSGCLSPSQDAALGAMNVDRTTNGLRSLAPQAEAQNKAQAWAEKLASENALYHSSLTDGIHTRWCSLGENVGYGADIQSIEVAYMNSAPHRANILASKYNGAGVGVARNGTRIWVVQEFIATC